MLSQKIIILLFSFCLVFPALAQEEKKDEAQAPGTVQEEKKDEAQAPGTVQEEKKDEAQAPGTVQEEKKDEAQAPGTVQEEKKEDVFPLELRALGKGIINTKFPNHAQAKILAERAAKLDAMRNLLEKIQKIVTGEEAQNSVSGFISGHIFQNKKISKDGTFVTIEIVLPLESLLKNYYQSVLFLEEEQKNAKELEEKMQKQQEEMEKLRLDWENHKKEQNRILQEKQEKIEYLEKELQREKKEKEKKYKELEEETQENALSNQKLKQEIATLQEQKEKEIQKNFIKQREWESLQNSFYSLQTRYNEQQKALLAFEENKKKFPEQIQEYKKKQEFLEKELQESLLNKKLLEKKLAEISSQIKEEENLPRLKRLQEEQKELQENFKKLIEILGHIHYENNDLTKKYHEVMKNLIEKEGELIRSKENAEIYKLRLQNLQKNLEEARQRCQILSQGYQNVLSQNRIAMKNISERGTLEQTLKEIYIRQQIFLNKFEAIEIYLQRIEEIFTEGYQMLKGYRQNPFGCKFRCILDSFAERDKIILCLRQFYPFFLSKHFKFQINFQAMIVKSGDLGMIQEKKWIQELFYDAAKEECLSGVLKKQGNKISRLTLIKILSDPKHREGNVPGSVFDLVQQKIAMEKEIERGLKIAKKQGLNWMEAKYKLNIGPGEDYMRLKNLYENLQKFKRCMKICRNLKEKKIQPMGVEPMTS